MASHPGGLSEEVMSEMNDKGYVMGKFVSNIPHMYIERENNKNKKKE